MKTAYNKKEINISINILALYFLSIPFEYVLSSTYGSITKLLGVTFIIVAVIEILFKYQGKIIINYKTIIIVLWIIYGLASYYWLPFNSQYWNLYYPIYTRNALMLLIVMQMQYNSTDYKKVTNSMLFGAILVCLYIIIAPGAVKYDDYSRRLLLATKDNHFDPNYLVAVFIGPIAIVITNIYDSIITKKTYKIIFNFIAFLLMFWIMLLSGSRGGFIGVLAVILVSIIINLKNKRKIILTLLFMGLFFNVIIFIFDYIPYELKSRFAFDSLTGQVDNGANRITIWKNALLLIRLNPLIGVGAGSALPAFEQSGFFKAVPHNFYLGMLLEYGFLGTLPFFIYISTLFKDLLNKKYRNFEIPYFIGIMVIVVFIDPLTTKFFWSMLICITIFNNLKAKNDQIID